MAINCINCGKEFAITPEQQRSIWNAVSDIHKALEEIPIPLDYAHTTLDVLDALVGCCDKPDITWEEKENEPGS